MSDLILVQEPKSTHLDVESATHTSASAVSERDRDRGRGWALLSEIAWRLILLDATKFIKRKPRADETLRGGNLCKQSRIKYIGITLLFYLVTSALIGLDNNLRAYVATAKCRARGWSGSLLQNEKAATLGVVQKKKSPFRANLHFIYSIST